MPDAVPNQSHVQSAGADLPGFGFTAEQLRQVMDAAMSRGADDCDLYFERSSSTSVGLSEGKVNQAATRVDQGIGVRVVVGDQVGYAYTELLEFAELMAAARTAAEIASTGTSRKARPLHVAPHPDFYPSRLPWADVDIGHRVGMLRRWEQAAFAQDSRVRRVQAWLADGQSEIAIVRPDGRIRLDSRPMTTGRVRCTVVDGSRSESNLYHVAGRCGLELYDSATEDRLVREAVQRTVFLLDAGKPPAGELPVVLAAGPSAILLHEAIGHGMEADFNRKGVSIYADRMNKTIASPQVTIVDDGTLPGTRGALNIDDEGNDTERTVLVEDGVLRTYMHDEISARHFGVRPTGSGRRESFRHAPLPRMRATTMEAGPHDPQEIIGSVDLGIYCISFANGQVNIGAGDFAFYMRHGYLIEGGRLTRPLKDVNIVGNGPAALERIDMVGNDPLLDEGGWTCGKDGQSVPVSQGMPTVRVGGLVVGGVG
jgi:TldD protein